MNTGNQKSPRVVVCIDDEEQILKALRRCLRSEDFELRTTTDPDQVMTWVREGGVNVVISDYRMQRLTGVELLKKVLDHNPQIVRVILSGYAEQESVNQALAQQVVYNYLLKPWEAEDLKAKIRTYFKFYDTENQRWREL